MILFILHIIFSILLTFIGYNAINPSLSLVINVIIVLALFILSFIIITLLLFIFFIVAFLIAGNRNPKGMFKHHLLTFYSRYIYKVFYRVKVEVIGKEYLPKNNKFVVYSNHIEYSDPIYIKQVFNNHPVAFISKESLFKVKIIKMVLEGIGCIPISRVADKSALNSIVEGIKAVKNGQPFGIFPEIGRASCRERV